MCLQIDRSTAVGYFPGDWSALFKCTFALAYVLVASYLVLFFLFWLCKSAFIDHPTTTIIVESSEFLCPLTVCIQNLILPPSELVLQFILSGAIIYVVACPARNAKPMQRGYLMQGQCQAFILCLDEQCKCCGCAILVTSALTCYLPSATSAYVCYRESKCHRSRCCCCC